MIIGTRGSALAMYQTELVVGLLRRSSPELEIEIRKIKTTGDQVTDRPLAALGGFGAFVKELDQKIVDGEIDIAVNSLKDMPVELTPGTMIGAVLPRGPVEDVLLSPVPLQELPRGAVIGSSSVRRTSLLLQHRPDLVIRDLRGNVPTRVRKWKEGAYDAIVLARAGVERLGIKESSYVLDPLVFVPAVGQGAIAIACAHGGRYNDQIAQLDDPRTRLEVEAERYLLRALGGGCSVPIGALVRQNGAQVHLRAVVATDPSRTVQVDRLVPLARLQEGLDAAVVELRKGVDVHGN